MQLLSISVALAFSASYEILEWLWVLVFYPDRGPEWLGMQNDPWDAQGDMSMALGGAVVALLLLSRVQDRAISACQKAKLVLTHKPIVGSISRSWVKRVRRQQSITHNCGKDATYSRLKQVPITEPTWVHRDTSKVNSSLGASSPDRAPMGMQALGQLGAHN